MRLFIAARISEEIEREVGDFLEQFHRLPGRIKWVEPHNIHITDAIVATAVPRLFIAASTLDLLGVELQIAGDKDRAYRLKRAVAELTAADRNEQGQRFSYILIDCPPSLNLLTINALASADAVLVPLQCEFFALEGLSQLLSTVDQVKRTLNARLSIHGIVLTMFDPRNDLATQVVADVRRFMGDKVYETVIPRNVRVSRRPRTASRFCSMISNAAAVRPI